MSTVVAAISGGIDSSVCAFLLQQQGHRVIGLFMNNWQEDSPHCPAQQDFDDAVHVCQQLQIPCYAVNFVEDYRQRVFTHFLQGLRAGHTPNPDVLCNREIKFDAFLRKALSLGADYIATGHYCRIVRGHPHLLLRGHDANKDQSYFLHTLSQAVISKVLFPLGALTKQQVRGIARQQQLITANKKESMGICFIGKRNMQQFLRPYLGDREGPIETTSGQSVGRHCGIAYYTIGQRKGLAIGGPGAAWFVVGKNPARNILYVAHGPQHPLLYSDWIHASELTWVAGQPPPFPCHCTAKIRYRQQPQPCTLTRRGDGVEVQFAQPQRAATPQQAIVFYQQEICLGGGVIQTSSALQRIEQLTAEGL